MNSFKMPTSSWRAWRASLPIALAFALHIIGLADTNPVVSVTVNGSASANVFRGMPLLISVSLIHPEAMNSNAAPILIAGQNAAWTNFVQLEISDSATNLQSWPFHSAPHSSYTITLTSTNYARIDQWLTPTQTLMLTTGQYTVVASLDTTGVADNGAWEGSKQSVPADFNIQDEPDSLSQADAENKFAQLAEFDLFTGDPAASLADASSLLALSPTNITGLRLKAQALIASGQTEQAESVVSQALDQVYLMSPNPPEPPESLFNLSLELQEMRIAPPQLSLSITNQQARLIWPGYSDYLYSLETSTDLVNWSLLSTNFNVAGSIYSFTIQPSLSQQFFRVKR